MGSLIISDKGLKITNTIHVLVMSEDQNIDIKEQPVLVCPHCKEYIIIEQLNCGIFRHGVLKNGRQMEPHAPKQMCDHYIENKLIYGCGKPFRIICKDKKFEIEICEYI